MGSKSTLNIAF